MKKNIMMILKTVISGARGTLKSWRAVLITWSLTLLLVSILAIPLKGALNGAFGNSMITEKLADGFNTEVFTDLGPALDVILSFFTTGLLFMLLAGFIMNVFLAGGIFSSLRKDNRRFSFPEFFRSSAARFWSFLSISLIMGLIISFLLLLLVAFPVIEISINQNISYKTSTLIAFLSGTVFVIVFPCMLFAADSARAWQALNEKPAGLEAIGYGFTSTFRNFRSSYPLMLFILLVQVSFLYLVFISIPGWRPVSEGGIILLFLVSQILFLVRVLLKIWRYGSVTAMLDRDRTKA